MLFVFELQISHFQVPSTGMRTKTWINLNKNWNCSIFSEHWFLPLYHSIHLGFGCMLHAFYTRPPGDIVSNASLYSWQGEVEQPHSPMLGINCHRWALIMYRKSKECPCENVITVLHNICASLKHLCFIYWPNQVFLLLARLLQPERTICILFWRMRHQQNCQPSPNHCIFITGVMSEPERI